MTHHICLASELRGTPVWDTVWAGAGAGVEPSAALWDGGKLPPHPQKAGGDAVFCGLFSSLCMAFLLGTKQDHASA